MTIKSTFATIEAAVLAAVLALSITVVPLTGAVHLSGQNVEVTA